MDRKHLSIVKSPDNYSLIAEAEKPGFNRLVWMRPDLTVKNAIYYLAEKASDIRCANKPPDDLF